MVYKNAIVTANIHGDIEIDQISKITIPRMRSYAQNIGADFIEWKDLAGRPNRHWRKLDIVKLLSKYDRILFLDIEVMIKDNALNIFDVVPKDCIGMFNEFPVYQYTAKKSMREACTVYNKQFSTGGITVSSENIKEYWNTSVLVISSDNLEYIAAQPPVIMHTNHHYQDWLNYFIKMKRDDGTQPKLFDIGIEFNCQNPFICRNITNDNIKNASFLNITGTDKQNIIKGYQIKLGEGRAYLWNRDPTPSVNSSKKLAIYTVCFGESFKELGEFTLKHIKAYADKIGADFIWYDEPPPKNLSNDRFELFRHVLSLKLKAAELLNNYDRVLHLDADILVLPSAPNIFDLVPEDQFGIIEEGCMAPNNIKAFEYYLDLYNDALDELGLPQTDAVDWVNSHYNIGVFVASKCHKNIFVNPIQHISMAEYRDISDVTQAQHHINFMLWLRNTNIFNIPIEFNMMQLWIKNDFAKRLQGFFIHYSMGENKTKLSQMKMLLSAFKSKYPEYNV